MIMSDEHLAVILKGIQARLEIALKQSSDRLPEEERLTHVVHIADACPQYSLHLPCDDDAHWAERLAQHPIALDPVAHLIDDLAHEILLLTKSPKEHLAPISVRRKAKPAKKRAGKKTGK